MNALASATKIVQTDFASFEYRESEKYIYITFFSAKTFHFTLENIRELYTVIGKLANYKRLPTLADLRNVAEVNASAEVKKFAASNPESIKARSANAILVSSFFNRLIVNIYLSINKPIVPTRLFNDEKEAIKWIKKFR